MTQTTIKDAVDKLGSIYDDCTGELPEAGSTVQQTLPFVVFDDGTYRGTVGTHNITHQDLTLVQDFPVAVTITAAAVAGRIMGGLAGAGGLAGKGGLAGSSGGLVG